MSTQTIELTAGEIAMIEANRRKVEEEKAKVLAQKKIEIERVIEQNKLSYGKAVRKWQAHEDYAHKCHAELSAIDKGYKLNASEHGRDYIAQTYNYDTKSYENHETLHLIATQYTITYAHETENFCISLSEHNVSGNYSSRSRGFEMAIDEKWKTKWYKKAESIDKFIKEQIQINVSRIQNEKLSNTMLEKTLAYANEKYPQAKCERVTHYRGGEFIQVTFSNGVVLRVDSYDYEATRYRESIESYDTLDNADVVKALINLPKKGGN